MKYGVEKVTVGLLIYIYEETIDLLSRLIATPSVSGKEQETAGIPLPVLSF